MANIEIVFAPRFAPLFSGGPFGYASDLFFVEIILYVIVLAAFVYGFFGFFAYFAGVSGTGTLGKKQLSKSFNILLLILAVTLVPNFFPYSLYPYVQFSLKIILYILAQSWWLLAFIILGPLAKSAWLSWRQESFAQNSKFKIVEIRIPREIERGPYAMDQVFQAVWQLSNGPGHFMEEYMDGEVPRPMSFEIVSFGGEIHFYARIYGKLKHLLEGSFAAYYPDVELVEVDDYINRLPATYGELRGKGYELWGTELILERPAAYPTRTYEEFERPDDETQVDPIGSLLEVLGKCKKEEVLALQFNLIAAPGNWAKEFKKLVEELKNPKDDKKDKNDFSLLFKTPRQTDILKVVEENLSRRAFDAVIRLLYFSPKAYYYDSFPRRGILGAFNQYASSDLNSFTQNFPIVTLTMIWYVPYFFPKWRQQIRSQRFIHHYRNRTLPPQMQVARWLSSHVFSWEHTKFTRLTTTIMATLFHPPMKTVLTAPMIKRNESKTAGPTAGLPIYGEEKVLEKFQ